MLVEPSVALSRMRARRFAPNESGPYAPSKMPRMPTVIGEEVAQHYIGALR